jgi:hypothetical protein
VTDVPESERLSLRKAERETLLRLLGQALDHLDQGQTDAARALVQNSLARVLLIGSK